jgi:hypothetical protein
MPITTRMKRVALPALTSLAVLLSPLAVIVLEPSIAAAAAPTTPVAPAQDTPISGVVIHPGATYEPPLFATETRTQVYEAPAPEVHGYRSDYRPETPTGIPPDMAGLIGLGLVGMAAGIVWVARRARD